MKKYLFLAILAFLCTNASALTLEDILRLYEANMGEEVILSLIATSRSLPSIGREEIVWLQQKGVGEKVILELLKQGVSRKSENKKKERELSPFDRFFLSPYYSHQYGWPEKNYTDPEDILERGLYYQPPDHYPDAPYGRVYGFGLYSRKWEYAISPFSKIVPKKHFQTAREQEKEDGADLEKSIRFLQKQGKPSGAARKLHDSEEKMGAGAVKPERESKKAVPLSSFLLGENYGSLLKIVQGIEESLRRFDPSDSTVSFSIIDIRSYAGKIERYEGMVSRLKQRIRLQTERGKEFGVWLKKRAEKSVYQEEKNSLVLLEKLFANNSLYFPIEDDTVALIQYMQDLAEDTRKSALREALLKKIVLRLQRVHDQFNDIFSRLDLLVFEFEMQ